MTYRIHRLWQWLFLLVPELAWAQWEAGAEAPRWLRLRLDEVTSEMNVDGQRSTQTSGSTESKRDDLGVEPSLGLDLRGSVYHPNQLAFVLQPQLGLGWQTITLDPPGGAQDSTRLLQRYHAEADLYRQQPFANHLFADRDLTYRDFDFFTRMRVDSERYGGNTGFTAGPVPFTVGAQHLSEDVAGTSRDTRLDQTTLNLNAANQRGEIGVTDLAYVRDEFERTEAGLPNVSGVNQTANLHDRETFGANDWMKLNSALTYHRLDGSLTDTRGLGVRESLDLEHRHKLASAYRYSFDTRSSGSVDSDAHEASASVRHQLYSNLTSLLEVHGSSLDTRSPDSTFDSTRRGIGLNEAYTKRLSTWGRLTLGNAVCLDHERRETTGGTLAVVDESHTLTTGGPITFLNQPNVDTATVFVTDATGAIVYAAGLDYVLITHGALTEIQRAPGGTIPNGSTVLVDYHSTAQPGGSSNALSDQVQFRLDFFDGKLGFYLRYAYRDHSGGEGVVLQDSNDFVAGVDTTWPWLHAGAEYEDFDSNLSAFCRVRLYQNFSFDLTDASWLGLDVSQSWTTFPDADRRENSYDFIGRYRVRLTPFLSASAEGGSRIVRGPGMEQDLATARARLDFACGQLEVNAGYEFEDEDYLRHRRTRHCFFLRAKRTF